MSLNNCPYVRLEYALTEVFVNLNYRSCLLTIGMNTVAIIMPFPGVFKVFDSHSRDLNGMPSALGFCVLISVDNIKNLVHYLALTSCSTQHIQSSCTIPFELKGVNCLSSTVIRTNEIYLPLKANVSNIRIQRLDKLKEN